MYEIRSLTSLRFISAFVVFFMHCRIHLGFEVGNSLFDRFISHGAVFMSVFFVLSGYILAYAYNSKDFNQSIVLKEYYIRRFTRIYPAYFFASMVYFLIFFNSLEYTFGDWVRVIINDLFLIQAFFSNMFVLGINSGTWSLSVEAFFYLVFPLVILLFRSKPKLLFFISIFYTLIININIISENSSLLVNDQLKNIHYSNPLMRLNEFLLGISFFYLKDLKFLSSLPKLLKSPFLCVLLFCIFSCFEFAGLKYVFMGFQIILVPLCGYTIFCLHSSGLKLIENRLFLYLGRTSYSFYIWQIFAMELGKILIKDYNFTVNQAVFSSLIFNFIFAFLSYHLLEDLCRNTLNTKLLKL